MLKKANRLAKARDIKIALAKGRSFFYPGFSLKFLLGPRKRLTVVVSTKVYKSAVKRNRLKRIVREYLRQRLDGLPAGDYLISAKPKLAGWPEAAQLQAFRELISKVR